VRRSTGVGWVSSIIHIQAHTHTYTQTQPLLINSQVSDLSGLSMIT